MKKLSRLIGGFASLIVGVPLLLVLPEVGVPLVLVGTRLLGDRYKWANALNVKVDAGWVRVKAWLKRTFRK